MYGELVGTLDEFHEFLDVSEFGLAFETLRMIGQRRGIRGRFHAKMREVAELMGLEYERESEAATGNQSGC